MKKELNKRIVFKIRRYYGKKDTRFKKSNKFGQQTLIRKIGTGGNGEVWCAVNDTNKESAIKLLKKLPIKPMSDLDMKY